MSKSRRGGRSAIGRASFTVSTRPSSSLPFHIEIADSASASSISTKPKPRDRPVIFSVMTVADTTAPAFEKASLRLSDVVPQERLPT